jgi:hypothetical protein
MINAEPGTLILPGDSPVEYKSCKMANPKPCTAPDELVPANCPGNGEPCDFEDLCLRHYEEAGGVPNRDFANEAAAIKARKEAMAKTQTQIVVVATIIVCALLVAVLFVKVVSSTASSPRYEPYGG